MVNKFVYIDEQLVKKLFIILIHLKAYKCFEHIGIKSNLNIDMEDRENYIRVQNKYFLKSENNCIRF